MGRIAGAQLPVEGLQESATIGFGEVIQSVGHVERKFFERSRRATVQTGFRKGYERRVDEIVLALQVR